MGPEVKSLRGPRATTPRRLGRRQLRRTADHLRANHTDGSPCDCCGRPMYRDRCARTSTMTRTLVTRPAVPSTPTTPSVGKETTDHLAAANSANTDVARRQTEQPSWQCPGHGRELSTLGGYAKHPWFNANRAGRATIQPSYLTMVCAHQRMSEATNHGTPPPKILGVGG